MAEAIVNQNPRGDWQAISAGTKPAGYVHPLAMEVLEEIGIQHQGSSKDASQFIGQEIDLVVTVCDSAAEDCPVWLGKNPQVHLSFEDPAAFKGDQKATLDKFRQVRDEISTKIPALLSAYPWKSA